jgi:alkanesulfonate monooxygenase SsuD/methylene tetrahydromethanopterin reductase-like flavin-dependent oxidoreductase (luciferase family)
MDFGIMFFSSSGAGEQANKYDLLMDTASFADRNGFASIWTPERHFHEFGGLYPNPSVLSAALAMIIRNVQIRAGSLISPLHDPVRIAEEWVVVD